MKSQFIVMLTLLTMPLLSAEHRICQRSLNDIRRKMEQELASGKLSEQTKALLEAVRAHAELRKHQENNAPLRIFCCPFCSTEFLKEVAEHYVSDTNRTCPLCHRIDSCKQETKPKYQNRPTTTSSSQQVKPTSGRPQAQNRPTATRPQAQGRPTSTRPRPASSTSSGYARQEQSNARIKFERIKERVKTTHN